MVRRVGLGIGAAILLLLLYTTLWPVPIDPAAWTPPAMPALVGVYQPNQALSAVERLGEGAGLGPEDLAFDRDGRLYAGMADGSILRFAPDGLTYSVFAHTGGRPLGLAFDEHGWLIVADAFKGLLAISPAGVIQLLTDTVGGGRINFADGVDIAADGTVFFTDASTKFAQDEFVLDLFEHRPNGRLLAYDPSTRVPRIVLDGLYFANGVAVSPDQSFVLVAEMGEYRIQRYWLHGPKQGQADVFVDNLPGLPDNIRSNGRDTFWVGLAGPAVREQLDAILPYPFLRQVIVRVPEKLRPGTPRSGFVLALDENGRVRQSLQDPTGAFYADITTACERDGTLYLGSSTENAIGRLPVPRAQHELPEAGSADMQGN